MKTSLTRLILLFLLAIPFNLLAQQKDESSFFKKDSITQKGFTLIYINKSESFDPAVGQKLKDTFFKVYPPMVKKYNKKSVRKVTFVIDPAYDGVAATSSNRIVYNPDWFRRNPNDIDVVTHEVMHIVQAYGRTPGPWWVTEGIADYVRYKYGVANAAGNWSLPDVNEKQNYDNSYRVTARFFAWIVKNKNKKFIEKMDKAMRDHSYNDELWVKLTGGAPADLWTEYIADPAI